MEESVRKWKIILTFASISVCNTMVKFIGEYNVKVDDKGRVIFPAAFKSIMPADGDMRFVVRKDVFEKCLEMYTFEEWERQSELVRSKLNITFN